MRQAVKRLIAVGTFAVAMAYCESAVVVYLREMYGIEDLLQDLVLEIDRFTIIEIGREASTMIMLIVIGLIAGSCRQDRIGYTVFAFGIWDILYYFWLYIFIGWPANLMEWDVLFLIPLPWWGPVLSPMLIALMMVIGGAAAVVKADRGEIVQLRFIDLSIRVLSILIALYVFMADAIRELPGGIDAVKKVLPTTFNWPVFIIALAGMGYFLAKGIRGGKNSI